MQALRIRQKDATFYFASVNAKTLLQHVRFVSRFHYEGEDIGGQARPDDAIGEFIGRIERSDEAFQRPLKRRKIRDLVTFYESVSQQPAIPGTVLLITSETLRFTSTAGEFGSLSEPSHKFDIIDGQHRIAGLEFYNRTEAAKGRQGALDRLEVPVLIFDGRSADYAAEMFVTINATQTKINKSHLVDLLDKVTQASPEEKFAAKIVQGLYGDSRSPLRYKINLLGGRSRQEKWILQSELYNEILKLVRGDGSARARRARNAFRDRFDLRAERALPIFIDYLRAVQRVFGNAWGNNEYQITNSVAIKAYVRILGALIDDNALMSQWQMKRDETPFIERLQSWASFAPELKTEGFFTRFAAKGQLERVRMVEKELAKLAKIGT
ncbi:MAG: DGQHR domain-containing protein [Thermoplasmatota archaeon]